MSCGVKRVSQTYHSQLSDNTGFQQPSSSYEGDRDEKLVMARSYESHLGLSLFITKSPHSHLLTSLNIDVDAKSCVYDANGNLSVKLRNQPTSGIPLFQSPIPP
ncbi:hypothetical protein TREMEDRAFT_61718 [Tremella mesenterica DSM 1558]|uniref:uncharacterized protein n=1 Tax=Tremella mesenterica (strain ATCC 24925 / CBS 8224 / DSM 1558 / NBRC 9311 / NRRL Y-6157 / RJB 2259-6 / UBC 559-6) TaxID=578456 RepID=UPI0003F4A649|nr:uncharacterized protein TREMEDRAFT_61718 [Tremella mesenterica DSM 1558]EIW69950.1 hypothetical protein TREMEDRAFT_61718 [Tremella mesenterica DSM 1558]